LKVLFRHITAEVLQRALIILTVITALMVLARGLEFLQDMAEGDIPGQAVLTLLSLAVPRILALALPLALFFGLLTTVARLCQDSEMDAMAAAGVGLYSLLPVVGLLGIGGLLLEAGLTLGLVPAGQERLAKATETFQEQALTGMVRPGQFNEFPGGRVLFFRERDADGFMREVFFHDPEAKPPVTVSARRGALEQGQGGDVEAVFFEGVRYQGRPRQGLVRVMDFDRYRVRKSLGGGGRSRGGRETLSTAILWQRVSGPDGSLADRVELFRRLTLPVGLPVLLLLALPLGVENRRSGTRSYGLLWGALLILAYHNGLIAIEDWAGDGVVATHLLLWGPPLPAFGLALFLLRRTVSGLPLLPALRLPRVSGGGSA